jgi:hypothetical protein
VEDEVRYDAGASGFLSETDTFNDEETFGLAGAALGLKLAHPFDFWVGG